MIILVTGSRDWPAREHITRVLEFVWACCRLAGDGLAPEALTVRHGANGNADNIAHSWAVSHYEQGLPIRPDPHQAHWNLFGKAAGGIRNQKMVDAPERADLCVAFSYRGSRGTADCMERARQAGIPVWLHLHGQPSPPPPPARLVSIERWQAWL